MSKPNIILIFPDEWRHDCINIDATALTPNVQRIANRGVIFTNCYTASPLCMPARASMMTGQSVHKHGLWSNGDDTWLIDHTLPPPPFNDQYKSSHVTRIRDNGYHTALIGKAHLDGSLTEDWGFDETTEVTDGDGIIITDRWDHTAWPASNENAYYQYLAYWHKSFKPYDRKNPWETPPLDMYNSIPYIDPPKPLANFDYTTDGGSYDLNSQDHYDTFVGQKAVWWINNYLSNPAHLPFYLQINFPGPHYPQNSTTYYRNLMLNINGVGTSHLASPDLTTPVPLVDASRNLCSIYKGNTKGDEMTGPLSTTMRQIYFANVKMIDEQIGCILDVLSNYPEGESNTWIFFCSDHGEMLGDHYLMYKQVFYDSATKVPLIIRQPILPYVPVTGRWQPTILNGLTDHLDLTATLLEVAQVPQSSPYSDGVSLLSKIQGNDQEGKDYVISEIYNEKATDGGTAYHQLMIRGDVQRYGHNYKLNVELNPPSFWTKGPLKGQQKDYGSVYKAIEFYNLDSDPSEDINLLNWTKKDYKANNNKNYQADITAKTNIIQDINDLLLMPIDPPDEPTGGHDGEQTQT
jgi:arylsulfatase